MAKVDYTVQILYNDRLRPTRIWGGDIVDAHHAGVRVAAKTYCTPTFKDADIVVANAYPQNAQAFHGGLWINYARRPGGTGVLIVQHPLGLDPIHYLNNRAVLSASAQRVLGGAPALGETPCRATTRTSIVLYALSASMLVAIMRYHRLPGAWLAGFLFALHPVCVEAVELTPRPDRPNAHYCFFSRPPFRLDRSW